jgi:hypothetical protein
LATIYLVPALAPAFIKAKLGGVGLLKVYDNGITKVTEKEGMEILKV